VRPTLRDIGMTKLYELMKEGRIVAKRVDGIRLINLAWLAQLVRLSFTRARRDFLARGTATLR
jgi:hypothetical protein